MRTRCAVGSSTKAREAIDVVVAVCSEAQSAVLVLRQKGRDRSKICHDANYAKPHVEMPLMTVDVDDLTDHLAESTRGMCFQIRDLVQRGSSSGGQFN